jgi:hypothetical protein
LEAPQNRGFCVKIECLLFGPHYMGEKARMENFGGKECGIKCVVLWGTHWEIEKHNWEHAGTHWEHVKNTKLKKFHPCTPAPRPRRCPQGKKR